MSVQRDQGLAPLASFYALVYGAVGVTLPYLPQHLRALGMSGMQVGILMAFFPLATLLTPLAWGLLADRTRRPALLLRGAMLGLTLSFIPLLWARSFQGLMPGLAAAALCSAPIPLLIDSITIERVRGAGSHYPRVRMWGTVGFVAVSAGFGFLWSGEATAPFLVVIAAMALNAAALVNAVVVRSGAYLGSARVRAADAPRILADRRVLVLLAATAGHWLACSPYHLLFTVHVKDLGMASSVAGLGFGAGATAEVAVMWLFPQIASRVSLPRLLAASFVASALRWMLVSATASPAPMVLVQLVHGLTFGAFMVASVTYLARMVPRELRATGQALFVSVTYGVGGVVGYLAVGRLYDVFGGGPLFAGAAALELIPALLALWLPAEPAVLGFREVTA